MRVIAKSGESPFLPALRLGATPRCSHARPRILLFASLILSYPFGMFPMSSIAMPLAEPLAPSAGVTMGLPWREAVGRSSAGAC
jgi:hypothetical protein